MRKGGVSVKLYIEQKMISAWETFYVRDEAGNERYMITQPRKAVQVGLQLRILDPAGNEIAFLNQKALSLNPTFFVNVGGKPIATIKKKFTLMKPKYVVEELGWTIKGDFLAHEYSIEDQHGNIVMTLHKEWLIWGDTFVLDMADSTHELEAIGVVLAIDCIMDSEGNGFSVNGKKLN